MEKPNKGYNPKNENEPRSKLFNFYQNIKKENVSSQTNVVTTSDKEDVYGTKTLQLPLFDWFVTKQDGKPISNVFTGSCRKDKNKGHLSTTTFNYKVSVSNVGKDSAKIIVTCFRQLPWRKGAFRENISESEYECSSIGLNEATCWLNSEWQKFMEDEKND